MAQRKYGHANNPDFDCPPSLILLPFGRRSYLPAVVSKYGGVEVELDETTDRIVYNLVSAPSPLALMYSGMGGPAVANALEMAAANGARRVVIFGACGGVGVDVAVGDLIVATGGVRGEGTSRYYAPPEYPAAFDVELTSSLRRGAKTSGHKSIHSGVVYTTDAGYKQGPEIYETYAGLVVGVESECATAAVVGACLGLSVGALLFVSDNVALPRTEDQRYGGLKDQRTQVAFDCGLDLVVEALA